MTSPAILYSTSNLWSAAAGLLVSVVLAYLGQGLLPVAVSACVTVYVVELLMRLL